MTTCEHCGSPLPDGAIFCGECGRSVTAAAARRPAAARPDDRPSPPPLQTPDAHGRRRPTPRDDPASDAWLPEATLDPATRAWLTGSDRDAAAPPASSGRPSDPHAPRSAPSHVHGAGSGLGDWTGRGTPDVPTSDGPSASDRPGPAPSSATDVGASHGVLAEPPLDPDAYPSESVSRDDDAVATPYWAPAPHRPVEPSAPAAPSWWVDRGAQATDAVAAPTGGGATAEPVPDAGSAGSVDEPPALVQPSSGDAARAADQVPGATDDVVDHSPGAGPTDGPRPGDTAVVPSFDLNAFRRPAPLIRPGSQPTSCHVCGHTLEPDDIFCEECGAVRPAVTAAFTGPVVPLPVARPDWAATTATVDDVGGTGDGVDADADADHDDAAEPEFRRDDEPDPFRDTAMPVSPGAGPETSSGAGPFVPTDVRPDPPRPPASATVPSSAPSGAPLRPTGFAPILPPVPNAPIDDAPPTSADSDDRADVDDTAGLDASSDPDDDVEETRIVTKRTEQAPFVLQLSTGERIGVHGSALLGRLPRPAPAERFEDLLTVHDPGKSVSKTHLELGRDGDDLWVSDRFSGNGTVVRHIDGSIRRCEPGRRYRVERGARVDIGEQFFLVQ